jgi:hypothetical protein
MHMTTITVRRLSVVSSRSFDEVVTRLAATIGRPDMPAFRRGIAAAKNLADLEALVTAAIGKSGLMEFARFDAGEILSKAQGRQGPRILRLVVGNPLIMREMTAAVHDAAAYAPVTLLIDERPDGVHLSYDTMESLLAVYEVPAALEVAANLDAKIGNLLKAAAGE